MLLQGSSCLSYLYAAITDEFDPENLRFFEMEVINTWLAMDYVSRRERGVRGVFSKEFFHCVLCALK